MTLARLLSLVALEHGVSIEDMRSSTRLKSVVAARGEFFYRARKETNLSSPAIGRVCRKDHSTVLYGAARYQHHGGK